MEIFKLFGSIMIDSDEANKSISKTEEKAEGLGTKLGEAIKTAAKWSLALGAAAGAVAIKLGKDVISAFGDYEQLVGGIDTLFKESSGKMQEYASNAYKTAGMSANEYMETVTGFSASLISSLGGDTEKATEYANMAITDMSDNANKMGTDISSIQNAYSGFAKQNYTMLDNLKLGYGGTKEEMARLLEDATAISGVTYDVSSYADVVDAIHVIQTEMEITGTTALEAEATIGGSISAMKASWENWLVGLGDSKADMQGLTDNLIFGFLTVLDNITPVINNIVEALPKAISTILPFIGEMLPDLLAVVVGLFQQVLDAVLKTLPELIPVAVGAITTIVDTLIDNLPLLINASITLIMALTEGLVDALPELIPAVIAMIILLTTELIKRIPEILEFVPVLFKNLGEAFGEIDWATLGSDLVKGIWNGIVGVADWLRGKVKGFVDGIKNIFTGKDGFDMHSPSKISELWMKWVVEGMAIGIENNKGKPISAMENLANAIKGALEKVNGFITSTVSIIEKEFDLWALKNDVVTESSEYLEQQLEMQKQKHELLNEQIAATTQALDNAINVYGVGSIEALNYKNSLLDLQIQQENLAGSIAKTNAELVNQNSLTIGANSFSIGNVSYDKSYGSKKKESDFDKYKDEIYDIANKYDTDLSVGYDMFKQNEIDKIYGREETYPSKSTGGITQNITVNTPKALSPSEIARETAKAATKLVLPLLGR